MLNNLQGLGDIGKWKEVLEAADINTGDITGIIGQLKECKKPADVVSVLTKADIDFDKDALLKAIKDTGVLDGVKGKLGGFF